MESTISKAVATVTILILITVVVSHAITGKFLFLF
jgi:hypothetical protein